MDHTHCNDSDTQPAGDCRGKLDIGRGCEFCHCGGEASASVCTGCFKLGSTDWLGGMPDMFPNDIFEVRFKNTRKSYFRNVNNLPLKAGDVVAVEASPGHDIGIVSLTGDLVARQMKRVGFNPQNGEFKKIYRKAKPSDIEKWQEAIALEHRTMIRSRQIAAELGLNMKIGDVEFQGDKIKAIFYYIADERVDFRELIKIFADQFRIRIEMKQIGARQEAGRIGGLGSCGRELCCASWISSFVSVTTNAARHQEISLNPQKLAGQCGKLKCCLIYELDTYLDARKDFPRVREPLQAIDGEYYLVKTDILSRTMWFSSDPHALAGMQPLGVDRVREIIRLNRQGTKVDRLDNVDRTPKDAEPTFANVVGEESLTRFDKQGGSSNKRRKGRDRNNGDNSGGTAANGQEGSRPRNRRDDRPRDGQGGGQSGEGQNRDNNRKEGQRRDNPRAGGGENRRPRPENREGNAPRGEGQRPEGERRGGERSDEQRRRNNRGRGRRDGNNGGNEGNGGTSSGTPSSDSGQGSNGNQGGNGNTGND